MVPSSFHLGHQIAEKHAFGHLILRCDIYHGRESDFLNPSIRPPCHGYLAELHSQLKLHSSPQWQLLHQSHRRMQPSRPHAALYPGPLHAHLWSPAALQTCLPNPARWQPQIRHPSLQQQKHRLIESLRNDGVISEFYQSALLAILCHLRIVLGQ